MRTDPRDGLLKTICLRFEKKKSKITFLLYFFLKKKRILFIDYSFIKIACLVIFNQASRSMI